MTIPAGNVRVSLSLPVKARDGLERLAEAERRTLSATVVKLLERALRSSEVSPDA